SDSRAPSAARVLQFGDTTGDEQQRQSKQSDSQMATTRRESMDGLLHEQQLQPTPQELLQNALGQLNNSFTGSASPMVDADSETSFMTPNAMHSGPGGMPQPLAAQNMAMALGGLPNMQYMAPPQFPQLQQLQLPAPPQPQPHQGGRSNVKEFRINSREFEDLANKLWKNLGAIERRYVMDILKNIAHLSGS
ncbi:hypothetical protein PRIPAC_93988, partial [Pristionchus pacificus]|uniref:Uncharacterized protein n=1 Tax=Pristionchus pacificus TaxID=54126 RepID=H3EUP8_PRIPA